MREKIKFIIGRIRAGRLQEMWKQTLWIYQYGKKYWLIMLFYTLLGMVSTVIALLTSLVSRDLVDIITGHQTGQVIATFAMMIGLNVGTTFLSKISDYASAYLSMKVDAEIKSDIFAKILVTDWESLTNYHTGDLLTRWGSDASNISNGVLNFLPNAFIYVFRFVSAFAMVIYYDASFALFAFLGMPVSLILSKTLMNRMINNNKKSAAMGAKMSGFNQETFSNIQTIKAFDLIHLYVEKLRSYQKEYIDMRLSFQRMSMGTSILLSTVGLIVSYAAYGWGIYRVWSGAISYGSMTMFLGLSGTLTGTLHNLTSLIPSVISLTTSAGRLMDIVEMPREDYSHDGEADAFLKKYRDQGIGLELREMDYAYQTGTQVFRQASMEAWPHEIVALVGPSGEGKTTMLRVILSLMQSQSGQAVLCGGRDQGEEAEKIPLTPSTRRLFSYVPQGNTMFSGTIAENMRNVKQDATDEEIIEALKLACAWDFVEKLPNGIDSEIKERGGGFSEGQAQRLSIARAILRKSPLLLLDEATSALDVATERKVLRNIMQDRYPRTCIVTTHRPTVLEACTRVYAIRDKKCVVLDDAEIEEMVRGF
ncbi:MAG: ABC transporter ATP-binding protein/permease [Eubacterium sp.]|nr:ABC transporter ATP-binding protein/permease [Eubacterium sp.]MCM1304141.1 ABC transporter ATP-binding protein/permease [Butyrivibrio sp.]MCM1344799.1 ABC transporter ATP-binding protein/permease [Muribaculaceae bacterium]MCM1408990.1 ABC transporter ATP-binding protein/permease [Lachnospiraceae bacterium]